MRPEKHRGTASDGAHKLRADRIEIDFSWSDQGVSEPSSRQRTRSSGRHEERPTRRLAPIRADAQVSEPLPTPTTDEVVAHAMSVTPRAVSDGGVAAVLGAPEDTGPARRTVVIRGHGTRGYAPSRGGYEARLRPHERSGFKPDRVALWAVLLGLALLLGAVTSSHAATFHAGAVHQLLLHSALIHPAP